MSTNALWIPVKPIKRKHLPTGQIKRAMARKYQDHDGSCYGTTILGKIDIPYLEGLKDGGNNDIEKDAACLIEAIEKHGKIEFIIE